MAEYRILRKTGWVGFAVENRSGGDGRGVRKGGSLRR